jgi:hypothetical protein
MIELRFLTARGFYVINRLHVTDTSKDGRVSRHRGSNPAGHPRSPAGGAGKCRYACVRLSVEQAEARLVFDTRIGRERVYAVNPVPLQSVAGWLEGYRAFWQASLTKLKRNLEAK